MDFLPNFFKICPQMKNNKILNTKKKKKKKAKMQASPV